MPESFRLRWSCVLAACALLACDSKADDVCENVGACAQGGDNQWIEQCKDEANLLEDEAKAAGCGDAYDAYFECAQSNFDCEGATPVFPGCEKKRASLDACLNKAQADTACAELSAKTSSCASVSDAGVSDAGTSDAATNDASTDASSELPPACTLTRDCQARCYLDLVSNVCAPRIDELSKFSECASSCP